MALAIGPGVPRAARGVRLLCAALLVVGLFCAATGRAAAHAELERSSPPANDVLTEAPARAQLWFTEPPEPRLTELKLLDPNGRPVGTLAPRPARGDGLSVVAELPDLTPGTYVLTWRVTSAVDGHTTRGSVPFAYGAGQDPSSMTLGLTSAAVYRPTALDVVARFLGFTGALGIAGGLAFGPLVFTRALNGVDAHRRRRRHAAARRVAAERAEAGALRLLAWCTLPAVVLGTILAALAQASEAADVSPLAAIGEPLARAVVGTRFGYLWGARLLLVAGLGFLLWRYLRGGDRRLRLGGLVLAGALLLTFSLGSHAAAVSRLTALVVAVDWLHQAAAAVWIGGLAQLFLTLASVRRLAAEDASERALLTAETVGHFSIMLPVVAVIAVTGMIQSVVNVGFSLYPLLTTPYGQTLLVKLGLVAAMGALGLVHWRVVGPRLRAGLGSRARAVAAAIDRVGERFRWTSGAETAIGIAVLLATGVLTAEQPAGDASVALRSVVAEASADDLAFRLEVAPGEAGLNRTELRVFGPTEGAQRVVLRLRYLDGDLGEQEVELQPLGDGVYAAQGGQFSVVGRWRVEPIVRRAGQPDARSPMTVPIAAPLAQRLAEEPPPIELTTPMVIGIELAIFGLILAVAARGVLRRNARASTAAFVGGFFAVGVGAYMAISAYAAEANSIVRLRNPVPVNAETLAQGRELYQQHCLSCHGVSGRGDGPAGRALNPRPADLRLHVMEHPEGQIFAWITDGVPSTAMPAFRDQLSADDRWRLVAFVRGFPDNGPPPAQTAVADMIQSFRSGR